MISTIDKIPVIISVMKGLPFGLTYVKFLSADGKATILNSFTCHENDYKNEINQVLIANNYKIV